MGVAEAGGSRRSHDQTALETSSAVFLLGRYFAAFGGARPREPAHQELRPAKTVHLLFFGSVDRISTSHVGKQSHTLRRHCRRLTRLTNAFSKKFENFQAVVEVNFVYDRFVKTHGALRTTPAMAAGMDKSHWTVTGLIERCGE
jgi:hypothetical protein